MARQKQNQDVDVPEAEVDEVETGPEGTEDKPATKPAKERARGDLPEGYVTPVGLAKVLGEKGLQKNREGEVITDVKPQMVYSYIKNAPKEDPFPMEDVTDSIGKTRAAVKLENALEWWTRKNERTEARKTNAAAKAAAKAERAAKKEAGEVEEAEDSGESSEVTEAE